MTRLVPLLHRQRDFDEDPTPMGSSAATAMEGKIERFCERGELELAATSAIQAYGPEILGFLAVLLRDETATQEVFAQFCEDLWRGLPGFQGRSRFRTWAYTLARNAASRWRRQAAPWRHLPLSRHPAISELEVRVRTQTLPHLRSEVKEGVARLRERLAPDDQCLLTLRVDRGMSWSEVAEVLLGGEEDLGPAAVAKKAAALRKRFERLKEELRRLAAEEGLLERR